MAVIGDNLPQAVYLLSGGVPVAYADRTAFEAAGWSLDFRNGAGAAMPAPAWSITSTGANGRHIITVPLPAGPFTVGIVQPAGASSNPIEFAGEGETYDADVIGSQIAAVGTITVPDTQSATSLTIVEGETINITVSVPEASITSIGASGLAVCTLSANIKLTEAMSSSSPTVSGLTPTIVSDTSGNRSMNLTIASFPAALSLSGSEKSHASRIDFVLVYSGKTVVCSIVDLTVTWKAS